MREESRSESETEQVHGTNSFPGMLGIFWK